MLRILILAAALLPLAGAAGAATYYVDFDGGSDSREGTSPEAAFKHCPGDAAATERAKATVPAPGDRVIFKGGVAYRGTITPKVSGREGAPITYDGNSGGTFGQGRAILDGSEPVAGWKRCASAAECGGNPHWRNVWYAPLPDTVTAFSANLCEGEKMLPIAQDPNCRDPFYQDETATFRVLDPASGLKVNSKAQATPGKGTIPNGGRPYSLMFDGVPSTSAVLDPAPGGALDVVLDEEVAAHGFVIRTVPTYTPPKEVVFEVDGKEILRATLADPASEAARGAQKLMLERPIRLKGFTLRVTSTYPHARSFAAIAELGVLDAVGKDVLAGPLTSEYTDAGYFTQRDPRFWDGATFVLYARPATIYYRPVLGYSPEAHKIVTAAYTGGLYGGTENRFSMMNALGILDVPGEYVVTTGPGGEKRVYLWPLKEGPDGPQGVTYSVRGSGFLLSGQSFISIEGFRIEKQGGARTASGIASRGAASGLVIRNNQVTLVRSDSRAGAIQLSDASHSLIDGNRVELNTHCAGLMLSRFNDSVASNNVLRKNGSTAVDFYGCQRSKLVGNLVTENTGVHANGLTFYVGCSDILVERNQVYTSNVGLTAQDGTNLTIRYNIFDGNDRAMCMGLWNGKPLKNVFIYNNVLVRSDQKREWAAGIFNGNMGGSGFVIRNNIIDGVCACDPKGAMVPFPADTVFSNNLYTRVVEWQKERKPGPTERVESDLAKIFVDPAKGDYHLRAGSPAIDAGVDVGATADFDGTPIPQGGAPDIGAFERAR